MTKPDIVITRTDHARLTQLANGLLEKNPELADGLLSELERAQVVEDGVAAQEAVQMGSTVEYEADGSKRRVELVYPTDADISENKVSILTPIGTALLGLRTGQSIDWVANDGRTHRLSILSVEQATPEIS